MGKGNKQAKLAAVMPLFIAKNAQLDEGIFDGGVEDVCQTFLDAGCAVYEVIDGLFGSGWCREQCPGPNEWESINRCYRAGRRGVGSAYREGILRAYEDGADLVLQFDYGQSISSALHVLSVAESLWQEEGWRDFLVFCQRTDVRFGRSWGRAMLHRIGSFLWSGLLPTSNIPDSSCGLRCWSRGLIETMPWKKIGAQGYFWNSEALFYALKGGAETYCLDFWDNPDQRSSLGIRQVLEALVDFLKLWRRQGGQWTRPPFLIL